MEREPPPIREDRLPRKEAIAKLRAAERLHYQEIEDALAEIQRIPPEGLGAFKSRLRHLRDRGTPSFLPQPGRGRVIEYCVVDALELLLALRLQNLGLPPLAVTAIAGAMAFQWWHDAAAEMAGKKEDLYVVLLPADAPRPQDYAGLATINPEIPQGMFFRGISFMPELEKSLPDEIVRICVSAWARRVIDTLERPPSAR